MYHPDFFFFDGEWEKPESYWKMKEVLAYYYNEAQKRNQEVFVNDRFGIDERESMATCIMLNTITIKIMKAYLPTNGRIGRVLQKRMDLTGIPTRKIVYHPNSL